MSEASLQGELLALALVFVAVFYAFRWVKIWWRKKYE